MINKGHVPLSGIDQAVGEGMQETERTEGPTGTGVAASPQDRLAFERSWRGERERPGRWMSGARVPGQGVAVPRPRAGVCREPWSHKEPRQQGEGRERKSWGGGGGTAEACGLCEGFGFDLW